MSYLGWLWKHLRSKLPSAGRTKSLPTTLWTLISEEARRMAAVLADALLAARKKSKEESGKEGK